MAINTVILEGLIAKEIEVKDAASTQIGTSSFCVGFYEKGEKTSEFFTLEMWGKIGTTAKEKIGKGDVCLVQGRLKLKQWTGKDGSPRKEWCIVVSQIDKLKETGLSSAAMPMAKAEKAVEKAASNGFDFDSLPF